MGQQVMVIRRPTAAPVSAIAVGSLFVSAVAQALADDTPLNGDILSTVYRAALINTPRDGAVVDDNVVVVGGSQSVAFVSLRVGLQGYVA